MISYNIQEGKGAFMYRRYTKRIITIFLFVIIISIILTSNASASQNTGIDFTEIDTFIQEEMSVGNIPGLALGIVQDDKIIYMKGFGTAGPGKGEVTPQTLFNIGCVSKSITGLAIMQLVEEGKINLEAPVSEYLPWFSYGGSDVAGQIKVYHLLNHTSGISKRDGNDTGIEKGNTIEERIMAKSKSKLAYPVGQVYEYSSINYDILGAVIQKVTKESYGSYVYENIFMPLDMMHTYTLGKEAQENGLAVGYRPWFGFRIPYKSDFSVTAVPSGYIVSSVEDMTHFLLAEINQGQYKNKSILSPEGMDTTHASIRNTVYSMGWVNSSYYIWHTGELANYNAYICIVPSEKLGIIMLSNTNDLGTKFLNRNSSALVRIPDGIRKLMVGGSLPEYKLPNYKFMYAIVDAAFVIGILLIFYIIWIPGLCRKITGRPLHLMIESVIVILVGILFLIGIQICSKASLIALLINIPDLIIGILIISLMLILGGSLRIIRLKYKGALRNAKK